MVELQLAHVFPEHTVEVMDLEEILRRHKLTTLLNWLATVWLYWRRIFRGTTSPRDCFLRTPFVFRRLSELAQAALTNTGKKYVFSIQTQSLFDAAVAGLPHFVYTDHTHMANLTYSGFPRSKLYDRSWVRCEREIYHAAWRTFTMSNHVRRSVIGDYGVEAGSVSNIGAGSNVAGMEQPRAISTYARQNILFVGVEWERKGGPELVEAFREVLKTHPEATLTIVGCSPALNLPNCRAIGKVPLSEMSEWYAAASIFCLPTRIEPFGLVFVEAQRHRLPIVAPDLGALPEIVESQRSGLLYPPGDVQALTQALLRLLESPKECQAFGEAGYLSSVKRYTWDGVGERLQTEIRSCLGSDNDRLPGSAADR